MDIFAFQIVFMEAGVLGAEALEVGDSRQVAARYRGGSRTRVGDGCQ